MMSGAVWMISAIVMSFSGARAHDASSQRLADVHEHGFNEDGDGARGNATMTAVTELAGPTCFYSQGGVKDDYDLFCENRCMFSTVKDMCVCLLDNGSPDPDMRFMSHEEKRRAREEVPCMMDLAPESSHAAKYAFEFCRDECGTEPHAIVPPQRADDVSNGVPQSTSPTSPTLPTLPDGSTSGGSSGSGGSSDDWIYAGYKIAIMEIAAQGMVQHLAFAAAGPKGT